MYKLIINLVINILNICVVEIDVISFESMLSFLKKRRRSYG